MAASKRGRPLGFVLGMVSLMATVALAFYPFAIGPSTRSWSGVSPSPQRQRLARSPLLEAVRSASDNRRPHGNRIKDKNRPTPGRQQQQQQQHQHYNMVASFRSMPPKVAVRRSPMQTRSVTSWAAALGPYVSILRPQNIIPAAALVFIGAWEATRDATRMADPTVLTMALASALVAVGSCVLNDWFDRRVDRLNKPESALVQGKVPSAHALLISLASLGLAFGTSFVVPAASLKHIVRAAVVAVVLYTPCFKPLPFLKNLVVASVTGASLALGGLATGSPFQAVAIPASLVFLSIYHREIVMDIDDVEGDAQCRIMTLPRLLGRRGALLVASGLLAGGSLLSAYHVLLQNLSVGHGWLRPLIPTVVTLGAGAAACFQLWWIGRQDFKQEDVSRWIALSPIPMAAMLFMLGTGGGGGGAVAGAIEAVKASALP